MSLEAHYYIERKRDRERETEKEGTEREREKHTSVGSDSLWFG